MGKISLEFETNAQQVLSGADQMAVGIKKVATETKAVNQEQENVAKSAMNAGNQVTQAMAKNVVSVKELTKEYKNLLSSALNAGGAQTEAGRKILKQAGEIKDRIGDIRAATNAYASDTRTFDTIAGGFRVIGDSIQGVAGVQALLGDSSKEYQEILTKLTGIMAINSAGQNLMNNLQAESALRVGIASAAQQIYTLVVGESTGALKAFRIAAAGAFAATGLGLIILAIAYWDKIKEVINGASNEVKKFNAIEVQRAEIMKSANEEAGKEIAKLEIIKQAINNEKLPREQRLNAVREYNKTAEEGNKISEKEIDNLKLVNAQVQKQTEFTIALATVKAGQNQLEKAIGERLQLELEQRETLAKQEAALSKTKANPLGLDASQLESTIKFAEASFQLSKEGSAKLIQNKQNEINAILALIGEYQTKYKSVLIDTEKETKKSAKRIEQTVIEIAKSQFNLQDEVAKLIKDNTRNLDQKEDIIIAFGLALQIPPDEINAAIEELRKAVGLDLKKRDPIKVEVKAEAKVAAFKGNVLSEDQQEELSDFIVISKGVEDVAKNLGSVLNSVADIEIAKNQQVIDSLNKKIEAERSVLSAQEDLQKKGLANSVATERKRLAELIKQQKEAVAQQKKLAKEKMDIDTATQAISLITSSAQIFQSLSSGGPVGIAIAAVTIAAMFAAFIAAQVKAREIASLSSAGFREGGYTGDGDPSEESTAIGRRPYKYHKREFVFDEEKTQRHREFFEALHKDDKLGVIYGIAELLKDTGVAMPDADLPKRLGSAQEIHNSVTASESNSELRKVRERLESIETELKEWKSRPKQETTSHNGTLIKREGNRTVIVTQSK